MGAWAQNDWCFYAKKYSEPCQTSKMECFAKIVNGLKLLIIFAKRSVLDVWQGSKYTSTVFLGTLTFVNLHHSHNTCLS